MAETGTVVRGPWRKSSIDPARKRPELAEGDAPVRVLLGFLTRECAIALGHQPTARELASRAPIWRQLMDEFLQCGLTTYEILNLLGPQIS